MRALVFKNLTSQDHKRKVLSSAEVIEQQGTRTEIHRHLLCLIKEATKEEIKPQKVNPQIFVIKKCDTQTQSESFLCRLKGILYVKSGDKIFSIEFIHSLRIHLTTMPTANI